MFVFAPPFLFRLEGHYQMMGQWLLLASLYLCFGPRRLARGAGWPVVAFTVGLVHSYMTAMVLGLWGCDMLRRVWLEGRTRAELFQLFAVPGLILLGFWQAGLFMMGKGITKFGFGIYRMNLLSLIDPSGWSYVLKDLPEGKKDYEGFGFLGLGGLLLALVALPALKDALRGIRERKQYWPLLVFLLGLVAVFRLQQYRAREHELPHPALSSLDRPRQRAPHQRSHVLAGLLRAALGLAAHAVQALLAQGCGIGSIRRGHGSSRGYQRRLARVSPNHGACRVDLAVAAGVAPFGNKCPITTAKSGW